jgi:hypothetical protein
MTEARMAHAPVVVLTYAYSGVIRMQRLLGQEPELACTAGTGVMAACTSAADAWARIEDAEGAPLTPLAKGSIRTLATGMLTIITTQAGRRRWCETSTADPPTVETFLQVFPETRLVCLHRAFPDVACAALRSNPWGTLGQQFAPFISAHPGNMPAALAGWWTTHAQAIIDFEARHAQSCLRVRYEDLFREPAKVAAALREHLGLSTEPGPDLIGNLDDPSGPHDWDIPDCGRDFPVTQLPGRLLTHVGTLHTELGYPELSSEPRIG